MTGRLPLPICAVCNKPVDRLIETKDPVRPSFVLIAECHGEREVVSVSVDDIWPASLDRGPRIELGLAFNFKGLTA